MSVFKFISFVANLGLASLLLLSVWVKLDGEVLIGFIAASQAVLLIRTFPVKD